jgi:hypothetical protein
LRMTTADARAAEETEWRTIGGPVGAEALSLPILSPDGAGETDVMGYAIMDMYFIKHAEGYVNENPNALDLLYLEGLGITIAVLVDSGLRTLKGPERRTRSGATTLATMVRNESGARSLALTSRVPRACIPAAAPATAVKDAMAAGCSLALTSRRKARA